MRAELRDQIISKLEEQIIAAGSESYDDGMTTVSKLLKYLQSNFEPLSSKEKLQQILDSSPEPSWMQMRLFEGALNYLPQIMKYGVQQLAKAVETDLPALPRGRPGLNLVTKEKIVAFVGKQHMKGYSLEQAKTSAAKHFGESRSTIQRVWDDRGNLGDVDFQSVLKFLTDGL